MSLKNGHIRCPGNKQGMDEMIDIHTHILPGIDDGAQDIYDTLEMVQLAADSGVTAMVATPHCNIPGYYANYLDREYKELFRNVQEAVQSEKIPVRILPGAEAFSTPELPKLIRDGRIMTLNQSRYLLMEFSFDEDPEFVTDIVEQVHETGVMPVIAHAERYEFVQNDPWIVYEWRKKGYPIQVNKGSFQGRFGRRAQGMAWLLMDYHLVSAIASDAHSPYQRTPYMAEVYEELLNEYPEGYLRMLFQENPRLICQNQPIQSLEPRPLEEEE